jgi:hypothetical protein
MISSKSILKIDQFRKSNTNLKAFLAASFIALFLIAINANSEVTSQLPKTKITERYARTVLQEQLGTDENPFVMTSKKDWLDWSISLSSIGLVIGAIYSAIASERSAKATENLSRSTKLQTLLNLRLSYDEELKICNEMAQNMFNASNNSSLELLDFIEKRRHECLYRCEKLTNEIVDIENKL